MQQTTVKPKAKEYFVCGGYSVSGPLRGQLGKFGYKCLFCNSYRCKRCCKPKLKKMQRRLAQVAAEYKLQRMVTLTLDPKKIKPRYRGRTDRYIRELWRMMRVLLARKLGKTLPFIGVLEFQKNGNAHLHLLVGQYIEQAWLSRAWRKIGGGRHVDIRFVDVHRVAAYLTKYLAGLVMWSGRSWAFGCRCPGVQITSEFVEKVGGPNQKGNPWESNSVQFLMPFRA